MRRFLDVSVAAAYFATLMFAAGCSDSGNQQQQSAPDDAPAPAVQKVSLKMTSVFPTSLELLGDSALMNCRV